MITNVFRTNWFTGGRIALLAALAVAVSDSAYGQNGSVGVAYPASGITIDGKLDDWPEGLQKYPIARIEDGDQSSGEADLTAHFRIAYHPDERALYVAVEVQDDSSVLDGPGEPIWNGQDGCELFLDSNHAAGVSHVVQHCRYGNQGRFVGPPDESPKSKTVAVVRSDDRIVYEWRVDLGGESKADRAIGFDISVADKDKDGSFSWAAWGSGTQKASVSGRCGEILLLSPGTRFGEITGKVEWEASSQSPLPSRVRIQSTRSPSFWLGAVVDPNGAFKASNIPAGPYSIYAVDSSDLRVETKTHVDVLVEADRSTAADILRITPVPWPGLIGDEGVLKNAGALNTADFDRFMQAYLDYYKSPGLSVAVIKDSKVVHHRGFGVKNASTKEPVAADTVFEAASMTKPVFAYTVLRLVDRGVLKLDTPLYTYLPYEDIAYDDRYKLITARMALTHRTGFPNWRNGKLDIKFTPGTEVSYSGEGFVYLGKVVEHLTGKKLVDLCREEVFEPLGIANASLVYNDDVARLTATAHDGTSPLPKSKDDEPNVAASLHISADQYAKFLIAVVQGKGLSESSAKEMLRPQVELKDQPRSAWGLGISIEKSPIGTSYGHGGRNTGFTSKSVMFEKHGFGYVFLVNNDDARKINNVLNAYLIAGKAGLENTKPIHKAIQVAPGIFDAYVGRYQHGPDEIVTITRDGDRLMAQATGNSKSELYPESETVFFLNPVTDTTVTFVKDDKGKVTHIVVHDNGTDITAKRLDGEPKTKEDRQE
jgi:CubicO group peptidase (beta-lactamase class C family)